MNFSASMAVSILLHSAVAVVVIAAPPADEEPARVLDEFVEARHVTFQPQATSPSPKPAPEPEPVIDPAPKEEPPPEPEPAAKPEKPEPEPAEETAPEPVEEKPEPEDPRPASKPPQADVKPVVANAESESAAEVTDVADAQGGVSDGRPDGDPRPGARASDEKTTGVGTPRAEPSGSDGVDRRALLRAWLKKIYVRVYRKQRYPRPAQRAGHQGKVVVRVWVTPTGEVARTKIAESSGHSTLDRASLELIETMSPLPRPPAQLGWKTRPIKIPVTYRLR